LCSVFPLRCPLPAVDINVNVDINVQQRHEKLSGNVAFVTTSRKMPYESCDIEKDRPQGK
jgi:hypothetical protein